MIIVCKDVDKENLSFLLEKGFHIQEPKTQYELVRYKKRSITITLYCSKKLTVQYSEHDQQCAESLFTQFNATNKQNFGDFNSLHVCGSDESLKGDTFGGLVVASFDYEPSMRLELESIGVCDSKKLSTHQIHGIAKKLQDAYPSRYRVKNLFPQEYNKQTKYRKVTSLLNELHAAVKIGTGLHVVDKYPGCDVGDYKVTKAETISLAVAAASIIARSHGLLQFHQLERIAKQKLPLGSTHVTVALSNLPSDLLPQLAKLHFRNVQPYLR